jgi:hypothetical protein
MLDKKKKKKKPQIKANHETEFCFKKSRKSRSMMMEQNMSLNGGPAISE